MPIKDQTEKAEEEFIDSFARDLQNKAVVDQTWGSAEDGREATYVLQDLLSALRVNTIELQVEVLQKYFRGVFLDFKETAEDVKKYHDFYYPLGLGKGQKSVLYEFFRPKHRRELLSHLTTKESNIFKRYELGAVYLLLHKACTDVCSLKKKNATINPRAYKVDGETGGSLLLRNCLWTVTFVVENDFDQTDDGPWSNALEAIKCFRKVDGMINPRCNLIVKGKAATINASVEEDFEVDLQQKLGSGGFGVVHLGKPTPRGLERFWNVLKKGDKVAVKNLRGNNSLEAATIECGLMTTGVKHPRIVSLIACYVFDNETTIVMPLYKTCIYKVLESRRDGKLGLDEARNYALDVLVALMILHANWVVHRDLKPENMLLDESGHVAVADLGCGQLLSKARHAETQVGTPGYQAPEIGRRDKNDELMIYDAFSAELFSFAMVVYAMLSGDYERTGRFDPIELHAEIDDIEACDFIKKLADKVPSKRMSLLKAFEHPFIRKTRFRMRGDAELEKCAQVLLERQKIEQLEEENKKLKARITELEDSVEGYKLMISSPGSSLHHGKGSEPGAAVSQVSEDEASLANPTRITASSANAVSHDRSAAAVTNSPAGHAPLPPQTPKTRPSKPSAMPSSKRKHQQNVPGKKNLKCPYCGDPPYYKQFSSTIPVAGEMLDIDRMIVNPELPATPKLQGYGSFTNMVEHIVEEHFEPGFVGPLPDDFPVLYRASVQNLLLKRQS